jgi:hypothetical protein
MQTWDEIVLTILFVLFYSILVFLYLFLVFSEFFPLVNWLEYRSQRFWRISHALEILWVQLEFWAGGPLLALDGGCSLDYPKNIGLRGPTVHRKHRSNIISPRFIWQQSSARRHYVFGSSLKLNHIFLLRWFTWFVNCAEIKLFDWLLLLAKRLQI